MEFANRLIHISKPLTPPTLPIQLDNATVWAEIEPEEHITIEELQKESDDFWEMIQRLSDSGN